MANKSIHSRARLGLCSSHGRRFGFSLLELLVVMAVFLIVGGAAFSLVIQHVPMFATQQSQSALNFSLRNAVAQMQIDIVNAGEGFYTGADVAAWPVGLTIKNNVAGTNCYDSVGKTYGPNCFDSLNVIATDRGTPPAHLSAPYDSGKNNHVYLTPPTGITAAQFAAKFSKGDHLLLLTGGSLLQLSTTTVTQTPATTSGGTVDLTCNLTDATGSNNGSPTNDPYGITVGVAGTTLDPTKLTNSFGTDAWALRIAPVTYQIDASDRTNPKLTRIDNSDCKDTPCVIAEQVIGFKVGASVWDKAANDDTTFNYDRATTPYAWSDVRAVRVTLIGRTDPNSGTAKFHNTFDGGNYRIEAVSVVVNPRNLSMND